MIYLIIIIYILVIIFAVSLGMAAKRGDELTRKAIERERNKRS